MIPLALHTALTVLLASGPVLDGAEIIGPKLSQPVADVGKGRTACARLAIRLTAYDDAENTRIRLLAGRLIVERYTTAAEPTRWEADVPKETCRRVARQLAMRWPKDGRWKKYGRRLAASAGGSGDTAVRIAIQGVVLRVRVAEDDVQDIGFVAILRGELFRLAGVASAGAVRF